MKTSMSNCLLETCYKRKQRTLNDDSVVFVRIERSEFIFLELGTPKTLGVSEQGAPCMSPCISGAIA